MIRLPIDEKRASGLDYTLPDPRQTGWNRVAGSLAQNRITTTMMSMGKFFL
jgi:hypothetical protein